MSTIGVVAAAAGGLETLRTGLVEPLVRDGHTVAVTLTPTAHSWLFATCEDQLLAELTGLAVRSEPRLPSQPNLHPPIDLYVAAPITANSVAKLALGMADNQALTTLCESITTTPMIVFPRMNAAHARHPAWADHLERLRTVSVCLIYGDAVWPLSEPRLGGTRRVPWGPIREAVAALLP